MGPLISFDAFVQSLPAQYTKGFAQYDTIIKSHTGGETNEYQNNRRRPGQHIAKVRQDHIGLHSQNAT